jgi:carbamate kinase
MQKYLSVLTIPDSQTFLDVLLLPTQYFHPLNSGAKEATALSQSLGWVMKPDGEYFRRVVPSPPPQE